MGQMIICCALITLGVPIMPRFKIQKFWQKIERGLEAPRVKEDYSGITGIALDLGETGGGESEGEQSLTITSVIRTTIDKVKSRAPGGSFALDHLLQQVGWKSLSQL